MSLSKRRGFVFQSSEIYGGLNGCWDYGPLGVELLSNIKEQWWQSMTFRENVEGLDAAILMHPTVWEASGHVENFTDPMVDCRECKARFRADQIEEAMCGSPAFKGRKAAKCQAEGKFTEARQFNLMFKTFVGPVEDEGAVVYLRPETAQGIFVNFLNVQTASRQKVPFGIAQIGKAFRNEINTKNFLFRTREFEQMEMQFFVKPGTDVEWFDILEGRTACLVQEPGYARGSPAVPSARTRQACPLCEGRLRHRVRSSRSGGGRSKASTTGPTTTSRATKSSPGRD